MSMEERVSLGAAAMTLPRGFVACEIGSYVGASATFLGAAASLKEGVVHCLDTWDNRAMAEEPPRDTYAEFLHNTDRFRSWIVPHRGESMRLAGEVPNELDLLFLDGDHSYEAVRDDLATFVPKFRARGLLLLHDWQSEPVQRALADYPARDQLNYESVTQNLRLFRRLA